ncbi:hypothetical protein BN1723_019648, partial [Verticillium longisporum]
GYRIYPPSREAK